MIIVTRSFGIFYELQLMKYCHFQCIVHFMRYLWMMCVRVCLINCITIEHYWTVKWNRVFVLCDSGLRLKYIWYWTVFDALMKIHKWIIDNLRGKIYWTKIKTIQFISVLVIGIYMNIYLWFRFMNGAQMPKFVIEFECNSLNYMEFLMTSNDILIICVTIH